MRDTASVREFVLEALSRNLALAYRGIAERAGRPTYLDQYVSIADNAMPFLCGPNNVTVLRSDADPAEVIRLADQIFGSRRYLLYSVWPMDLTSFGFLARQSPAMTCTSSPGQRPSGLQVIEVTDEPTAAAFAETLTRGFGYDARGVSLSGLVTPHVIGDQRLRFWLGLVEGRPVAASWSAACDGYAGVYGVAAIPEMRRRGYGEALTRAAMNAAPELPAALQSSPMGTPLYLKMGFREVAEFDVWRPAPPAAEPAVGR